ncbi:MAG: hypothetical protein RCO49_07890 [Rickettsia endosymbiont of Argas persicus]
MKQIIENKKTEDLEQLIMWKYDVSRKVANTMINNYDERACKVLQEILASPD